MTAQQPSARFCEDPTCVDDFPFPPGERRIRCKGCNKKICKRCCINHLDCFTKRA